MKRRDVLKSALLGTSVAISGDAASQSHTSAKVSPKAPASAVWKPLLFDAHQSETVTLLADLIIPETDTPGAREAGAAAYIDLILNDGDTEVRENFLKGLGWLDGYAIRSHNNPFRRLTSDQQTELLSTLDRATRPELRPGARFFKQIKQLTIEGYYTSKVGIDELNKHGVPNTYA